MNSNPWAIAAVIGSFVINLLMFSFFLGFVFGTFKEFKKNTEEALAKLMSVYFTENQQPRRVMNSASRKSRAHVAGADIDYDG